MLDVASLMNDPVNDCPVLRSTAYFQHALACRVHETIPNSAVRLEFKPFPDEPIYIDAWLPESA